MASLTLLAVRRLFKSTRLVAFALGLYLTSRVGVVTGGEKLGFSDPSLEESSQSTCAPVDWYGGDDLCCPWVTFRAGALAMHRSSNQAHAILWEQATGRPLLSTTDVNPDWTTGAEVDLLLRLTHDWDVEFDWFTLGDWSRDYFVDIGGVVTIPLGLPLTSGTAHSSSDLNNFEFNLRYRLTDRICLLGGFRYLELDDYLHIHYEDTNAGLGQSASIAERNRLYGFQIGSQAVLWQAGPWQVDGWVKAGIFGNESRSTVDVSFTGIPITLPALRAGSSDAAFVGDLGLRASRRFGQHVQIYGGYRVMLLDGVALTSHQIDAVGSFFNGGSATIDTGGSPFYHGAELGLIVSF